MRTCCIFLKLLVLVGCTGGRADDPVATEHLAPASESRAVSAAGEEQNARQLYQHFNQYAGDE